MIENQIDDQDNTAFEFHPRALKKALLVKSARSAIGVGLGNIKQKIDFSANCWVFGTQLGPFSFDNCCKEFGADPDEMRDWLRWYKSRYNKAKK